MDTSKWCQLAVVQILITENLSANEIYRLMQNVYGTNVIWHVCDADRYSVIVGIFVVVEAVLTKDHDLLKRI